LISEGSSPKIYTKNQDGAVLILLEVERPTIVLFHAWIEGYDGMATVKTIDEGRGVIAVITTEDFKGQVISFLESVRAELPWRPFSEEISTDELFEYREV